MTRSAVRAVSVAGFGGSVDTSSARKRTYSSCLAVAGLSFAGVLRAGGGDVSGAQAGPGSRPVESASVLTAVVVVVVVVVEGSRGGGDVSGAQAGPGSRPVERSGLTPVVVVVVVLTPVVAVVVVVAVEGSRARFFCS